MGLSRFEVRRPVPHLATAASEWPAGTGHFWANRGRGRCDSSGRTQLHHGRRAVVPDFEPSGYDISPDGGQVIMETEDREGKPRLWVAALDGKSPPRQIPNVEGRDAFFGPTGEIFFRHVEGYFAYLYRVRPDGTNLRKALNHSVLGLSGISPDGKWAESWASLPDGRPAAVQIFPLAGRCSGRNREQRSIALVTGQTEAVCSLPIEISSAGRRHVNAAMEPGKAPHAIGERAKSKTSHPVERAAATCPVTGRYIEHDIAVEHDSRRSSWYTEGLIIVDPGVNRDLRQV